MDGVCLEDVQRAYQTRDPSLPELVVALANAPDPPTKQVRSGELTYQSFLSELRGWSFRYKTDEEKQTFRISSWKILESPEAPHPLPDRLWLHTIVSDLWAVNGPYERDCLIKIIMTCPLKWGPWRALKRIFKEAEARDDMEIYGALAARFDMETSGYFYSPELTRGTLLYLVRRAWRQLRRRGESFAATYPDAAVEVLRHYRDSTTWNRTWVANHIFFHNMTRYNRPVYGQAGFMLWSMPDDLLKDRAFAEAWQRSPRPLFSLLERAQSERARKFAVDALKADFRTALRDIESSWIVRLTGVPSASAHEFVVWLLKNVPKFEAASFRQMGLHEPVLLLLDSPSNEARAYAASYARTHARDLSLEELVRLVNNDHAEVRKLAFDLLRELDPREGVGLDWWGKMLGTQYGHDVAVEVLRKHFGASELTPAWFRERLLSDTHKVVEFAKAQLLVTHQPKNLGSVYFTSLFDEERLGSNTANFALHQLISHFEVAKIELDFWRRSLLHPMSQSTIQRWIGEDKLKANTLGVEFWRSLSYHPAWEEDAWIAALKGGERAWARGLTFNSNLAHYARQILGDTRQFSPEQVGFDWLMSLVVRLEQEYNQFAEGYLLTSFMPADFAPKQGQGDATLAGCEALWQMATQEGDEDESQRTFAIKYLRQHHPGLGPELTGKPLAPAAQIPTEFFAWSRVKPLLLEPRQKLRKLALELGQWELARWAPPLDEIVELCELRLSEVTRFFERALLAEDIKEHERFRLGRDKLTVSGVYRFCESLDKTTRRIGMALIARYDDLAVPAELFRLTESPDRQLRAFVIRRLWHLFRDRGVTPHWKPTPVELQHTPGKKKPAREPETGPGPAQRPEGAPAPEAELVAFLRRELFGIPPAKLSKDEASAPGEETAAKGGEPRAAVRPVAARKAKLSLIEVLRDLATEDAQFAQLVAPLLAEFMGSRGKSERDACLVALTRMRQAHPQLLAPSEA